jgi:hypothetical protein
MATKPYLAATVVVNVAPAHNNGSTLAPAIITAIRPDGKLNVRVLYDAPSHSLVHPHADHITEVVFHDTDDPEAANRQGLYGAFWPQSGIATILDNQEKIMAAQDDITAAATAITDAANTMSTVATDLQAVQANIQAEIAALNAQIAAAGAPVDTTALNTAVEGLAAPVAALQAADTALDGLETPAAPAPAAPASGTAGSTVSAGDTGTAA